RLAFLEAGAFHDVGMFPVAADALEFAEPGAEVIHPHLAEGIEERGAPVANGRRFSDGIAPVDAVPGEVAVQDPVLAVAVDAEELVTPFDVLLLEIEPDGRGVATARVDDVRVFANVKERLVPLNAVPGGGVAGGACVAGHVPHLEEAVGGGVSKTAPREHTT